MAYFTQHKRSSVPFLCPLRTPSTVCAYIHEKFALFYYILFSMCTRMQYNGSQRPAFGSLFSRVCLLLLCSQLSDMQCPWVHSFTADSSSWLLGLKLRCRPRLSCPWMYTQGQLGHTAAHPDWLIYISQQCGRASCPPVPGSICYCFIGDNFSD